VPLLEREDGVGIHWEERGEGPLVVLAPYAIFHPSVYDPVATDLATDHRVVRYDDRGTGESSRQGPYDMHTGAADLMEVIEAAGSPAVIVGLGDSCHRAVRACAERPDSSRRWWSRGACLPDGAHWRTPRRWRPPTRS
jgi:pimeloyl-ACP methyl ester carboxylesterase